MTALLAAIAITRTMTAHADDRVAIGSGTALLSLHGVPQQHSRFSYSCTLTAVGYDNAGRLIGITNAHCFYDNFGDQWLYDAIYLERPGQTGFIDVGIGPIGHVAVIGPGNPVAPGPSGVGLDYAVIVFDSTKVAPSASVGATPVTDIGPPPPPGAPVCRHGSRTGRTCGIMLGHSGPYFITTLIESPGDSGAPVLSGSTLIGTLWMTSTATSISAILADLDQIGGIGAGFHLATR
ncbi:hypothetical protein [Nocardia sp. NPDC005366]|uniref:hypothetical protein n=1 Tax=Nocardia sp. NPDC005366 TaxID=3156878 RepID=UPI0033B2C54E